MRITRRGFIKSGMAAAVSAVLWPWKLPKTKASFLYKGEFGQFSGVTFHKHNEEMAANQWSKSLFEKAKTKSYFYSFMGPDSGALIKTRTGLRQIEKVDVCLR